MTDGYYVTAIRDGKRVAYLFGPVADPDVAKLFVPYIRGIVCRIDPWCAFDAFGTAKLIGDNPPGKLNKLQIYSITPDGIATR